MSNVFQQYFKKDISSSPTFNRYRIGRAIHTMEGYRKLLIAEQEIKKYNPKFEYDYVRQDIYGKELLHPKRFIVKIDDYAVAAWKAKSPFTDHIGSILFSYELADQRTKAQLRKEHPIEKLKTFQNYAELHDHYYGEKNLALEQDKYPLSKNDYFSFDYVESHVKRRFTFNSAEEPPILHKSPFTRFLAILRHPKKELHSLLNWVQSKMRFTYEKQEPVKIEKKTETISEEELNRSLQTLRTNFHKELSPKNSEIQNIAVLERFLKTLHETLSKPLERYLQNSTEEIIENLKPNLFGHDQREITQDALDRINESRAKLDALLETYARHKQLTLLVHPDKILNYDDFGPEFKEAFKSFRQSIIHMPEKIKAELTTGERGALTYGLCGVKGHIKIKYDETLSLPLTKMIEEMIKKSLAVPNTSKGPVLGIR